MKMMGAGGGQTEIVEVLIGAGADVNVVDEYGETALKRAVAWGQTEVVGVLIEAGAVEVAPVNEWGMGL